MKRFLGWGMLSFLQMLGACGDDEPNMPEVGTPETETEIPEEVQKPVEESENDSEEGEESSLSAYFMENGTTAHFKGEGHGFAELDIRTDYLEEAYVAVYEDNGGTTILRVYRLTDDRIELVEEQPEFYEEYTAAAEELNALEPISTYLEIPIELGDRVKDMEVVELDATVETPYEMFENALVAEQESEGGGLNRLYLVEGYGEVKREFIMEEGEETFTVTSSLETIE